MAKLTSLKMTAKEAKSEMGYDGPATIGSGKENLPRYPYGTKVRLESEALDKLGVSPTDYKVGDVLEVSCKVEVVGTSIRENQGGKERKELELQITDMALGPDKAAKKQKASGNHLNSISGPTSETVEAD